MASYRFSDFAFSATPDHFRVEDRRFDDIGLVVVDAPNGTIVRDRFANLGDYLLDTDVLAINDVGMGPSRLKGRTAGGLAVDVCFLMLVDPDGDGTLWDVVVLAGEYPPESGAVILADGRVHGEILGKTSDFDGPYWIERGRYRGFRGTARFARPAAEIREHIVRAGLLMHPWYTDLNALPAGELNPFLTTRNDAVHVSEPARRISPGMYESFRRRGIQELRFSLSMCFSWRQAAPETDLASYRMNQEEFSVPPGSVAILNQALTEGRRIVSIGTSGVRTLESLPYPPTARSGRTDIFIAPGYRFRYCSVLLTNLHNPMGTHVIMAAAVGGRDLVIAACEMAARAGMKFGIHGDSMLVIGHGIHKEGNHDAQP